MYIGIGSKYGVFGGEKLKKQVIVIANWGATAVVRRPKITRSRQN